MRVLVVNAGSSSLKVRLVSGGEAVDTLDIENWSGETDQLESFVDGLSGIDAVGHRIVHGGPDFTGPVAVRDGVRDKIAELSDLAPLHQPRGVAGLDAVADVLPDVPAVACFDTAFHHALPAAASTYAVPREWASRWGVRRYGFHGLSHAYVWRRAGEFLGRPPGRLVSCHLGAGASLAAVLQGRSVDTTMGFTPLDGLVMATRSGSLDPGLVLWLLRHMSAEELTDALEHKSGLAGLSGHSDLREVLKAGDTAAVDVYVHRLRRETAAMTAALGGLDTLVLTGGIGEHQPSIRAAAAAGLAYLGVSLDAGANAAATADADVTAAGAPVTTLVLTAREDLEIAHQVETLLG